MALSPELKAMASGTTSAMPVKRGITPIHPRPMTPY